jgi:CheY-like chemotaxis protein
VSEINWSKYAFLIVDDVRLCRLSVLGILKTLGCKTIHSAANGIEAVEILEDETRPVDCVIADFKMPEMNGLQLLQAVRIGLKNTRRDLPVAMLTGCGDHSLVGLAVQLDVNSFLLKPANKGSLVPRLQSILLDDLSKEPWLRDRAEYERIDVNTLAAVLLDQEPVSAKPMDDVSAPRENETLYHYDTVPENTVLSRDLCLNDGRLIYAAETVLTNRHVTRLKGLKDIGFWDGNIFVRTARKEGLAPEDSRITEHTFPAFPNEPGAQRSTLSRLGKLHIGDTVNCFRCEAEFPPNLDILRIHNRGELTSIFCPDCDKRDMELLCAAVKLMIIKGGFPLTIDQLTQAFRERDPMLPKGKDDPFVPLRATYADEPLTGNDIKQWIRENYFVLNSKTNQLDCMINKVLSNPERVRLLGKEGIEARQMAAKRAQHLPR